MLDRAAAVAVAEIQLAVEPQHHAVDTVVGVNAAKTGQERVALVGLVIAVGIFENQQVGAVADEDAAARVLARLVVMFLDGNSHGDREDLVGEHRGLVGLAVAVGVFEDLDLVGIFDAVKSLVAAAAEPIVEPLGDPDSSARVDIDGRRIDQKRLGRPERRFEAPRRLEPPRCLVGRDLRERGRLPCAEDRKTPSMIPATIFRRGERRCIIGGDSPGSDEKRDDSSVAFRAFWRWQTQ